MAFSWSRKTIDELLVLMAFTVRNSAGKRSTNATFARSGKLENNVQENKLDTSVFVEQENNRKKIMFSWYLPLVILREKRSENAAIARSGKL